MSLPLEEYALIGDCQTAGLVSRRGSIDWLCVPRFDSGSIFAALLGTSENGHWQISPQQEECGCTRRYRDDTLILETHFKTDGGEALLIDFMPQRTRHPEVIRIVRGVHGKVALQMKLVIRCDYGSVIPWVTRIKHGVRAIGGPDGLLVFSDVEMRGENFTTVAEFTVSRGQQVSFALVWYPSYRSSPPRPDVEQKLVETEDFWKRWSSRCTFEGKWKPDVLRSLITLKALTDEPTGGIVASPTTSLPEKLGGIRNWDYRYCWVRDATLCLDALMASGYTDECWLGGSGCCGPWPAILRS